IGEGTDSGELLEWHVVEGQEVCEDDPLAEVETDKARVTIPCPTTGRVLELRAQVGDRLPVGEVMAVFEPVADTTAAAHPPAPPAAPTPHAPPQPIPGPADEVIPLRGVRRTIARTMTEAWQTIPHIIDYREADATALLAWRDRLRERADYERMTITPLLLRIAVDVLRRHPYVNASIDLEREEITLRARYNIGIATATSDGLIVPVVQDADGKSVSELALEVAELTRAARERRLRPEQLTGGTFTLNNYGSLGGWLGTPIIKPGEVAILGVGRVQERPVARDRQVVVRPIVALAVSGDHRVLDGHTLGAFVSDVVAVIEDPAPVAGDTYK
ncbi:MAG: 2-oxo acid dehydrogenase subunit E2, partial [Solirubrobacterales bacterium]|nr:2-oxo acid dehydrogenase subunit E2 [Solirubrobacterales bacterium]